MSARWFEDFALGQSFRSRDYAVSEAEIIAFATAYDPQPQHLGHAEAARSSFGALVASGWHTGAISMRLIVDALPGISGIAQGAGVDRLSWPRPVRPGDVVHAELEVIATRASRSRPDRGLVTFRNVTVNQAGNQVMTADHTVMLPRVSREPDG